MTIIPNFNFVMSNSEREKILNLIYKEKDYTKAEDILKKQKDTVSPELLAKLYFFQKRYKEALSVYKKLNVPLFAGYCELFSGNKKGADKFWSKLKGNSPAELWVKYLSENITEPSTKIIPSYFLLRNFYEIDLYRLIDVGLLQYAENLISATMKFCENNAEVFKYTARVLFLHGYFNEAMYFVEYGEKAIFEDVELHFIKCEILLKLGEVEKAKNALNDMIKIDEEYFPIKVIEQKINGWH